MLKLERATYRTQGQSATASYPHGNLQDSLYCELEFSLERVVFLTDDLHVFLTPPSYVLGSVDNDRIIYQADDLGVFEEFQVGDTIYISTAIYTGTKTIVEKIDNNTIRVAETLITHEIYGDGEFIACTNIPKSARFNYNFIATEDNISYGNVLDNQTNTGIANNLTAISIGSTWQLINQGSNSHNLGINIFSVTEKINNYKFILKVTQNIRLFPFLKNGYVQDLESNTVFDDIAGSKAYDHIFSLELLQGQDDEANKLTYETKISGNTGAYNEHFNTGISQYNVQSIEYKLVSTGEVIQGIDYNGQTDITIVYKSDGLFTGTLLPEISFLVIHDDFDNYLDISKDYLQNFGYCHVNKVNAFNSGTDYRVFNTALTHTIIDADTLEIKARISLGSKIKENIEKSAVRKYALFVTCEQSGLSVVNQTRSRDLVDLAEFVETLPSINLITTNTTFWLDPSDVNTGFSAPLVNTFDSDDVYAVSSFSISKTTPIKLISIKNEVIAQGSSDVILDSTTTVVGGSSISPEGNQIINSDVLRPLNQSYKSNLVINTDASTATDYVYNMSYPFIVGYRDDLAINGQSIPAEMYDITQVGNGLSNDWAKYVDIGSMSISYRVTYVFDYLGKKYNQVYQRPIIVNNYDNPEWTTKSIKLYDTNNVELLDGSDKFIIETTTIKALFSKSPLPAISNIEAYFFVAKVNDNGYRTSSSFDNTFKKIVFGTLSVVGSYIQVTGTLNADDFQSDVRIWCRIFEKEEVVLPNCILITEEGDSFITEDETSYLVPEVCNLDLSFLLKEDAFYLLKEDGDKIIL